MGFPNSWFVQRASRAKAESYSAFGQATWTPAGFDAFPHRRRAVRDNRDGVLFTVVGKPTNFTFNFEDDRIDPLVTAAYDINQDVNVYATYSTGFRAAAQ